MITEPLVSIIVITYNSSKYVLETLDSAKAQTYKNIELIVSDDCSTDNTVLICQNWLEENKPRFVRTELILSEVNTGVALNCNRGLCSSKGEWIKILAGDDILLENCISDNVEYVLNNTDISFLFSKGFSIDENSKYIGRVGYNVKKMKLDVSEQFHEMLKSPFVSTPSAFIRSETLRTLGGYNEKSIMLEDYPLWIKATKNNIKLFCFDKDTILYRKHSHSIMSNITFTGIGLKKLDPRMLNTLLANLNDEYLNDLKLHKLYRIFCHVIIQRKAIRALLNKQNKIFYFWIILKTFEPYNLMYNLLNKLKKIAQNSFKKHRSYYNSF